MPTPYQLRATPAGEPRRPGARQPDRALTGRAPVFTATDEDTMTTDCKFNMADALGRCADTDQMLNLIGSTMISAEKRGDDIVIVTNRGTLTGKPEGDCCSHSWVESVECEATSGAVFLDRVSFDDDGRDCSWADGNENKVYFGTLYTDKGRVMWEMRNESNGYYGGWLNWSWEAAK